MPEASSPADIPDTSIAGELGAQWRIIVPLILAGLLLLVTIVLVELMGGRGQKVSAGHTLPNETLPPKHT